VIDFDAIASAPLRREPFEWALVERAIDPARAASLIDTFPVDDFWRLSHDDGEKSDMYAARPLVILGDDRPANLAPLPGPWRELVDDLLSPEYRSALSQFLGEAVDDALMEAAVWRWDREAGSSGPVTRTTWRRRSRRCSGRRPSWSAPSGRGIPCRPSRARRCHVAA
jgi:hypothetical protein